MASIFDKYSRDKMSFSEYLVYKGEGFEAGDLIESLTSGTRQYWTINTPPNKAVILTSREISASGGPVFYYTFPSATGITEGTELTVFNRRANGRSSSLTAFEATVTTPGTGILKAVARGTSGGTALTRPGAGEASIENIIPAGQQVVIGVEPQNDVTNLYIRLDWIELPDLDPINS